MKRSILLFSSLSLITGFFHAQIPPPNSTVHYTEVYFEERFAERAESYELQVYADSLKSKLVYKGSKRIPAFSVGKLQWGKSYWWVMNAWDPEMQLVKSGRLSKFSVVKKVRSINVEDTYMKVIDRAGPKVNKGVILLDHSRGIFDREGRQLWSVPELPGVFNDKKQVHDLRITADNTITFLGGNVPVEIDFEGRLLWKAPSPLLIGNDTITYHHDFKKIDGRYYVCGNKKVLRRVYGNYQDDQIQKANNLVKINDTLYKRTLHGLILEFDAAGNLVWFWDSNEYVTDQDINHKKNNAGMPVFGTHMNAFSVDRSHENVYVGFRDLNRIVRIDKATKKVTFSFGERYPSGDGRSGHDLFRGQHDATITDRNTILILNNNNDQVGAIGISSVMEIRNLSEPGHDLLVWKFDLNFDTLTDGKCIDAGNLEELPNGNLLVCGGMMPRIFEVTKKKQVVWDAMTYCKSGTDTNWARFPQYRAHYGTQLFFYNFVARADLKPCKNGECPVTVEIFNTGTDEDAYQLELLDKDNAVIRTVDTKSIRPDASLKTEIKTNERTEFIKIVSLRNRYKNKILRLNQ